MRAVEMVIHSFRTGSIRTTAEYDIPALVALGAEALVRELDAVTATVRALAGAREARYAALVARHGPDVFALPPSPREVRARRYEVAVRVAIARLASDASGDASDGETSAPRCLSADCDGLVDGPEQYCYACTKDGVGVEF